MLCRGLQRAASCKAPLSSLAAPLAAAVGAHKVPEGGMRMMSTGDGDKPKDEEKAQTEVIMDGEAAAAGSAAHGGEAADAKEAPPKPQVYEGETVVGEQEGHEFKAETRQLLDIVANSLYADKEVFIRELVSNASDALEKARYLSLTQGGEQLAENLEVHIVLDPEERLFMVQDNGVGMSAEELRDNLGTIARSGSKRFMQEMNEGGGEGGGGGDAAKNIIGKFGVGFYSSFMVAEEVKVFSRKRGEDKGHCWTMNKSDGSYSIAAAEGVQPGTKIVLRLREDCADFCDIKRVREVVTRFSTFVSFPLLVNKSQVNDVRALWLEDPAKVSEEDHSGLFKHLASAWDEPMYTLMYRADAPIDIKSVFYVPSRSEEQFGQRQTEVNVHLHSRRVLIQKNAKDLLPEYLRFVKGVVDSEDLPLSISRETMQDKALMAKLKSVLTKRIIRWLNDEAKNDPEKYKSFYDQFGLHIKEGVAMDQPNNKQLVTLLRYNTTAVGEREEVSLQSYVDRMKPDQDTIYYLICADRKSGLASPYYEAFKRAGVEVVLCYALHDEIVMGNTQQFGDKKLESIEVAEPPAVEEEDGKEEGKEGEEGDKKEGEEGKKATEGDSKGKGGGKKLSKEESEELMAFLRTALDTRLSDVDVTNRLVDSPAIVSEHDSAVTRRMMQMEEFKALGINKPAGYKLLINPSHPLIVELHRVRGERPEVARLVAEQLLDNAMIAAGILDHVQSMMPRLTSILKSALSHDDIAPPAGEGGDAPAGEGGKKEE